MGDFGHAHFGVTHCRGAIAIYGTEVTLAINQHVPQRKWLGHTHDGVINSRVAVRVIFTDHVTNNTGGLLVGLIPVVVEHVHGKEHTAMHRLQAIAHVRQCPSDDDAHGVVEVGLL